MRQDAMGPKMKLYLAIALIDAPPQERQMKRGAWEHYHHTIVRQFGLDRRATSWEMPRLLLIAMLALNTWLIIGLIGSLTGYGFWWAVRWTVQLSFFAWLGFFTNDIIKWISRRVW
jgi:hypothetical protein